MTTDFYSLADFIPARSIGYLIKRIERLGSARAEAAFADRELSFSQWIALSLVRHRLVDNCAKLSRSLGHNSGATTRLVDQLEERGLLRRARDTGDRRIVNLDLTDEGQHMLDVLTPRVLELWNEALVDFDKQEVETLIALLGRLLATLEAREAAGAQA